jgi:5,10-methylenetetrahydromethanopterin reductase
MREYVEILRRFLNGETVQFKGGIFQIHGAKMGFVPARPIEMYLTAVRSRMLQLGGEIGDGVLLSAGCAPGYIQRCVADIHMGAAKAGKAPTDVDVAGFVTASVAQRPREAIDANKLFLAYIFRNAHHAENIKLGGGRVDQEGLAAAVAKRDWPAAKQFISDDVVHAHSVAGTAAECRSRLETFVKAGLDLPVLLPMGTQEARKKVVRLITE